MEKLNTVVHRVFKIVLFLIVLTCLSISPMLMQDMNALEPTNQMALDHPVDEGIGIKNGASLQKILPHPVFTLLFYILPIGTILRYKRLSRFHYPSVFLLRKKLILQPIQFTSMFLIRACA